MSADIREKREIEKRRRTVVERITNETTIRLVLDLDGVGDARVETGLGFWDHMLGALAKHGRFDMELTCTGDLEVDDHHTVEDTAIVLGAGIDELLGDRRGIARFGSAYAPLDEALARAVIDLCGRPFARVDLGFARERIGAVATENLEHGIRSLAVASRSCIHMDIIAGENDHHRAEAGFKALALALRQAVARDGSGEVPSTKGVL